jgi:glycosyltransferase involved in cell wall biosynthesis
MSLISVVIPVHNKRPHLRRAVESVLAQTMSDFDLVVVDDASTDGSLDEIADIIDPRLRRFARDVPGPGGYAARNFGMTHARCRYVAFLDADDEWLPEHLLGILAATERFPDRGLYTCGWKSVTGSHQILNAYDADRRRRGEHEVTLADYARVVANAQRYCVTSVVAVDVAKAQAVGGFPDGLTKKGGDLLLWVKLIKASQGVWSPRLGGILHRDSINMVTNTQYFSPALFQAFRQLTHDVPDTATRSALHRYINRLVREDYLRTVIHRGPHVDALQVSYHVHDFRSRLEYGFLRCLPAGSIRAVQSLRKLLRGA